MKSLASKRIIKRHVPKELVSGVKHDQEKPELALISSIAITRLGEVMSYGKKKYAAHNWRAGISQSRLLSAALRHLFAYIGGENKDAESGLSHLAHAMACVMMLIELTETKPELDDRYANKSR